MQAGDIARTQGDINGLNAARAKRPGLSELRKTVTYKAEMQQWGTGSAIQQDIQAATAVLQGLSGATCAVMGEFIAQQFHPGVDRKDLTEAQAAYGRATDAINKIESALKGHGI